MATRSRHAGTVSAHAADNPPGDVRKTALAALAAGLSVWPPRQLEDPVKPGEDPIDKAKAPLGPWKRGTQTLPNLERIRDWYGVKGDPKRTGVGAILGKVSGHAECMEFDASGAVYEAFIEAAAQLGLGDLVERIRSGYEERSAGGGIHWLFRSPESSGNTKLAQRPTGELDATTGRPLLETLIETRGEGGYIILAPTYGTVHPSGNPYQLLRGSFATIATITADERKELFALARCFDEPIEEPEQAAPVGSTPGPVDRRSGDDGPTLIEDFNARADWAELLPGWVRVFERGGVHYLRRSGKDIGVSGTVRESTGRLWVFSTSTVFLPNTAYSKFAAFARLYHADNFKAAASALGKAGYGAPPRRPGGMAVPSRNGHGPGAPIQPDPPKPPPARPGERPILANYRLEEIEVEGGEIRKVTRPVTMPEITTQLDAIAPGWPKIAGGTLFVEGRDGRPRYLEKADQLMAWVDGNATVDWLGRHPRAISPKRFYEHIHCDRDTYDAVEMLPHWPPLPRVYYMHAPVAAADNGVLDAFLDRLCPATDDDRELVRSMILTYFWGGEPGTRPAFLITGADEANEESSKGRGYGKSTLASLPAEELCGGSFNASRCTEIDKLKTRFLSRVGRTLRSARLDNIKTLRFSWDDLEELITSPAIGGHEMWKGEGSRPNTLVWTITLNGANLSKDLAQRVIPIMLNRPQYNPHWGDELLSLLRNRRADFLANIRHYLERDPAPLSGAGRWAAWERGVLARVNNAEAARKLVAARQGEIDDDDSTSEEALLFLRAKIRGFGVDPDVSFVRIPSPLLSEWATEFLKRSISVIHVVRTVSAWGVPGLKRYRLSHERGMTWRGASVPSEAEARDLPPFGGF